MKNLKKILTTPFRKLVSKGLIIFLIVIAAIGFIDSAFLTIEHFMNQIPPCTLEGCDIVLTSAYATILGIPVALLGAGYYIVFLALMIAYLDSKKEVFLKSALLFTIFGLLASIYFFILQAFIIHSFCQYCLLSATTSTILFVTAVIILYKDYKNEPI